MTRLLQLLYLMLISSSFEVLPFQPSPLLCFSSNPKKSLSFLATPFFLYFFLIFNVLLKKPIFSDTLSFPPDHHLPSIFFSSPKSSLFQPSSSKALHSSHHSLFRDVPLSTTTMASWWSLPHVSVTRSWKSSLIPLK